MSESKAPKKTSPVTRYRVMNALESGYENRQSLQQLYYRTGLSFRTIRKAISDLRKYDGLPVISHSGTKGYWLPSYTTLQQIKSSELHIRRARQEAILRTIELNHMIDTFDKALEDIGVRESAERERIEREHE